MIIPENIKQNHKSLSQYNLKFIDFIENSPEAREYSNFKDLDLRSKILVLQPWPTFINQKKKSQIQYTSTQIFNLIKSIPKRIFANNPTEISNYYNLEKNIVEYSLYGSDDIHRNNLLGRGDFVLSSSGLKCVEYNIASNLGGWQIPLWNSMYLKNPIINRFMKQHPIPLDPTSNLIYTLFDFLIDNHLNYITDSPLEMNIAIVFDVQAEKFLTKPEELFMNQIFQSILKKKNNKMTGNITTCHISNIKPEKNGLTLNTKPIHTLLEYTGGIIPAPILQSFAEKKVLMYNGPITNIMTNKLNIAILSEFKDTHYFNDTEKSIIENHIPWTRKIKQTITDFHGETIQLVDFIRTNKDLLVIKPTSNLGGIGVFVGKNTEPSIWENVLNESLLKEDSLVQEFVSPIPLLYLNEKLGPTICNSVCGFFTFGNRYAGGMLRVLPVEDSRGVVNSKQGATISPLIDIIE